MQKTMMSWLSVLCLTTDMAFAVETQKVESGHASLQAYPKATIAIKDLKTGVAVHVDNDGRHVVGVSRSGEVLWHTEVVGENYSCTAGSPVVRYLQIEGDKVSVTFCKSSYGEIELKTGEFRFLGQD
ncbi:MAG: hypothetical protein IPL59_12015 [Candidatus Competibacteraceae bacterium]|nr:hypothetical protein [Candidatus Competibacteraceae bacterium]MBK8750827.1 hypothetical protein [Candidatus Competibacteraceae bacterium]